jgi:hypothetical protein
MTARRIDCVLGIHEVCARKGVKQACFKPELYRLPEMWKEEL